MTPAARKRDRAGRGAGRTRGLPVSADDRGSHPEPWGGGPLLADPDLARRAALAAGSRPPPPRLTAPEPREQAAALLRHPDLLAAVERGTQDIPA